MPREHILILFLTCNKETSKNPPKVIHHHCFTGDCGGCSFSICVLFRPTAHPHSLYFTILMFYQRTKVMTQVQIWLFAIYTVLPAIGISHHSQTFHHLTISLTKIQTETAIIRLSLSLENRNFLIWLPEPHSCPLLFLSFPAFSLLPLRSIWIDRFAVSLMGLFVDKS